MKLHRFYIEIPLKTGEEINIEDKNKLHQWLNVFRMKSGDKVVLFNGNGKEYESVFTEIHKAKAVLEIGKENPSILPSKEIHLYMSVIKKDLFELVVEKATELGVTKIIPIETQRSIDKHLNFERLNKIAIESSEQCGRGDIPIIEQINNLQFGVNNAKGEILICNMDGVSAKSYKLAAKSYSLFVGPEGGWGEKDIKIFQNRKATFVSLGKTILRAETAAIVGIANIN